MIDYCKIESHFSAHVPTTLVSICPQCQNVIQDGCLLDGCCVLAQSIHDPNIQLQKPALREQYAQNANSANDAWLHLHHATRQRRHHPHSFVHLDSFVCWGKAFLRVAFSRDPCRSVPVEEERDVKRLTVFVLPKKLQLLLLLSAQGVDDGDGQPQGLSRITVWPQGVYPGAGRRHVFCGTWRQTKCYRLLGEKQPTSCIIWFLSKKQQA